MTINPHSTMQEVLATYPGAQRALFRKYHIGGCASCGFRPDETLAEVCARNESLPVNEVIAQLLSSQEDDAKMQIAPAELAEQVREKNAAKHVDVPNREGFQA